MHTKTIHASPPTTGNGVAALLFALTALTALTAWSAPLPAQIQGLDGYWSFYNGVGEGRGNVTQKSGSGAPAAGRTVTLRSWVAVREEWPGNDSSARRPMWATKTITVGPVGRRLLIDNHLVGKLTVEDTGGEARVAAKVSVFAFDPRSGPLAGRQYPAQRRGPKASRLTAVSSLKVDQPRNDWVWLDPGSYVIEVYTLVSAKMTTGVGGDHASAQFAPGDATYGFTATFSDGGVTRPRQAMFDRRGLGTPLAEHADASAVIGGATQKLFFATAVARDDAGNFVLAGSNALAKSASLAVVEANGSFVSRTPAPAGWAPTTDLARDPQRGFVYLALADRRLHCFDPASGMFIDANVVPIQAGLGLGDILALAYDPVGDFARSASGRVGSFWISDGVKAAEIAERDGQLLRHLTLPSGLSLIGAAFHPGTRQVWWLGQKQGSPVAVLADAASGTLTGLELVVGSRAITNGGEITLRDVDGAIEQELTLISTDAQARRVYRTINATFVCARSDGGQIGLTGRPTPGGSIRVTLGRSEGSQALLMLHGNPIAPLALAPVLGVDSVLALPFDAVLLPPVAVQGGRASHPFGVPNQSGLVGAQVAWQWLVVTPSAPLQTSDAGTHRIY